MCYPHIMNLHVSSKQHVYVYSQMGVYKYLCVYILHMCKHVDIHTCIINMYVCKSYLQMCMSICNVYMSIYMYIERYTYLSISSLRTEHGTSRMLGKFFPTQPRVG